MSQHKRKLKRMLRERAEMNWALLSSPKPPQPITHFNDPFEAPLTSDAIEQFQGMMTNALGRRAEAQDKARIKRERRQMRNLVDSHHGLRGVVRAKGTVA